MLVLYAVNCKFGDYGRRVGCYFNLLTSMSKIGTQMQHGLADINVRSCQFQPVNILLQYTYSIQ